VILTTGTDPADGEETTEPIRFWHRRDLIHGDLHRGRPASADFYPIE